MAGNAFLLKINIIEFFTVYYFKPVMYKESFTVIKKCVSSGHVNFHSVTYCASNVNKSFEGVEFKQQ